MPNGKIGTVRLRAFPLAVCTATLLATAVATAALPAAVSAHSNLTRPAVRSHIEVSAPLALDAPDNGGAPLIAYAPDDGYTYVAWNEPNLTGIDLCVLAPGATSCAGGGPVLLTDSSFLPGDEAPVIAGLTVLPSGEVVVLGASAAGASGTIAWASAPGGAAFLTGDNGVQNFGNYISPVSLYEGVNNAVALNDTDVAVLDSYDGYFSDSPYAGPETPSSLPAGPNANATGGVFSNTFQRRSLEVNGSEIGAEAAPAPAAAGTEIVVGVGDNFADGSYNPSGCLNSAATGYGVDVGKIGTSTGSGYLNHSGIPSYGVLDCSAEAPAVASGGGAGIGVIEEEGDGVSGAGSTWTIDWRPFDATATGGSFGSAVELQDITNYNNDGGFAFDASEDSADGVYASWVDLQGLVLDYSANGGASWDGDVPQKELSNGGTQGDPVIAGVGAGIGEVAYDANLGTGDQVYVETVDFEPPAPTALSTKQTSGPDTGATISVTAGTVGETDKATLSGTNSATATGRVTYSLYSDSTCTASKRVATSTETVSGTSVPASAPVTKALGDGDYYWQASYSGDEFNQPSKSSCGSEVLKVTPVSISGSATASGSGLTLSLICKGVCTITVTIEKTGLKPLIARAKGATKFASGKFRLDKTGKQRLKFRLTKYARSLFKHDHDKLTALLLMKIHVTKPAKSKGKYFTGTFNTESLLKIRP